MKIKIIQCKDKRLWYANKINEEYTVELKQLSEDGVRMLFWCRTGDRLNTINFVHESDAKIVGGG